MPGGPASCAAGGAQHAAEIASANWSPRLLAARVAHTALFIDMGSTTTDVVPLVNGAIAARGYTDAERLAAGELVYTGLVRGFVMATADRAPFAGRGRRWSTRTSPTWPTSTAFSAACPTADLMATADGRDKTVAASRARLARMVGGDAADCQRRRVVALARWFAEAQLRAIVDAAMLVVSAAELPSDAPVVGAGIGARSCGSRPAGCTPLCRVRRPTTSRPRPAAASHCAPAAALALLASE